LEEFDGHWIISVWLVWVLAGYSWLLFCCFICKALPCFYFII